MPITWGDPLVVNGTLPGGFTVISISAGSPAYACVQGPGFTGICFDAAQFWTGFGQLLDALGVPHP